MKLQAMILILTLIFAVIVCGTVSAASNDQIYVNGLSGNDSWDGQSATWTSGTTIGPKLSIKNATGTVAENGTVNIANGLYSGANNTNITLDKSMTIKGQSQTGTIINGTNTAWIFLILTGVNVTIQNLTLANGNRTDSGGAIHNWGNLTVTGCNFTSNTAYSAGGAISNDHANLTVTGSTFIGNTAAWGGAIDNWQGNLTVTGCTFTSNTANNGGGAINNGGNLTVTGSTFAGNTAQWGVAINNGGNLTAHFNRIMPIGSANGDICSNSGTVDVEYNWWGTNFQGTNPVTVGRVYGVTVSKWLVLIINSSPATVNTGGTSTITADLLHDQSSVYYDPANGHVPDGIPVLFSTTLGSISNALTSSGKAVATLSAGSTPGIAAVNAAADNQTVNTNVNIIQGWKLVTYTYPVSVPVLKWYKSHGKWKFKYVYVKVKKWYKSHGKLKSKWVKVKKYRIEYRTGQRWELT